MNKEIYSAVVGVAKGIEKADLVLKSGKVFNVFTGEFLDKDIAIKNGVIAGVGQYEGEREIDLKGKTVLPGFIDAHLHMESTLVSPSELIENTVKWGTTTYIVDPHEAANVKGLDGIDYILDETENVPANVYVMMPSCVPATPFEDNGCKLTAQDMKPYVENPRVLGLGEVMDYVSVVGAQEEMLDKLELFRNKVIDGHAPFLSEKDLTAYALAGIKTDHECVDFEYAMQQRRNGMHIHIREGSAAKNLEEIIKGVVKSGVNTDGFSFCTDDKHIEDIRREGHISFCIKKAVSLGLDIVEAIRMATINTAKCYNLSHLGAIAPGYQADLVVVDDVKDFNIVDVFHCGKSADGFKTNREKLATNHPLKNTVNIKPISLKDFEMPINEGENEVIGLLDGQILTKKLKAQLQRENGLFVQDNCFNKLAVIERHHATGKIGLGAVAGFGIKNGAIASSVSHDSHNISVIGDNDADMLLAVQELERTQGGYTVVSKGKVLYTVALPIMGLMSDVGFEEVNETLSSMIDKAHEMGVFKGIEPFITLSFIALPVIPEIRLTPRGMFDVTKMEFIK